MVRYCPICKKDTERLVISRDEKFIIRGEELQVSIQVEECSNCHTEFQDMNSEYDPLSIAFEKYRALKRMLQPNQIIEFRKKYKLTQRELGDLLGFGAVTLSRYENGALQDEAHDKLLRFILKTRNLLSSIELKPNVLSSSKKERLINSLRMETLLSQCFPVSDEDEISIYTGNRSFDINKMINMIKFLTHSTGVFKTKLLKLLFYADFLNFKRFSVSITGTQYAHLPLGPVPEDFNILIGTVLEADKTIQVEERTLGNYEGEVIISSSSYDHSCFSNDEISILQEINTFFHSFTSRQIKEFSHKEKAYLETSPSQLISYDYAKSLNI